METWPNIDVLSIETVTKSADTEVSYTEYRWRDDNFLINLKQISRKYLFVPR